MDEDQFLNEPNSNRSIVPIFWKAQDDTEFIAEVFETLVAGVKAVHLVTAKQEFHAIRQEGVIVVFHHDTLENFFIRGPSERFQDQHDWNNIFLLPPAESKHGATVGEVMEGICYTCLVKSDAAYLYGRGSIRRTPIGK